MIYENRVRTTVYLLTCKNGEVIKKISDDDFEYNTDEPVITRYDSPDEAIDDFLSNHKGWTFECVEGENGCKKIVATSPLNTSTYSCRYMANFLNVSKASALEQFRAGELAQYQIVSVLEVYEVDEKPYGVEKYLDKFKA